MSLIRELIRRGGALPIREMAPASLLLSSLDELGWHRSARDHSSVSADGSPTPWWTYGATAWLDLALKDSCTVFEFGSGGSTSWLAQRVRTVHSVEHNPTWDAAVRKVLPVNAVLTHVGDSLATDADAAAEDPYLAPLLDEKEPFDVIVIDGLARNECCRIASAHVRTSGLVLLDDADRVAYQPGHQALMEQGFGRIDFYGPRPGVGHLSVTSLFSRDFDDWARGLPPPRVSGY
jgi:hypothetical protein